MHWYSRIVRCVTLLILIVIAPIANKSTSTQQAPYEQHKKLAVSNAIVQVNAFLKNKNTYKTGTAFFVGNKGYLLTNEHVIKDAESVWIWHEKYGGHQLPVSVVGSFQHQDLALLKLDPKVYQDLVKMVKPFQPLHVSSSKKISPGTKVATYGYSAIKKTFVRANGIVKKHTMQQVAPGLYSSFIQSDVETHPGNSGSPLLTNDYKVIGVHAQKFAHEENGKLISSGGLSIPIDVAMILFPQLS